jgi:hypothetical protein
MLNIVLPDILGAKVLSELYEKESQRCMRIHNLICFIQFSGV